MAKRLGVDTRVSRQMLLIAVMCSNLQRYAEAEQIVRAVMAFRADIPHPATALAGTMAAQGRWQDAAEVLEDVLSAYPNHQLGKALLGVVNRERGHRGWDRLLQEVIDDGRDEWSIKLARDTIGFDYKPAAQQEAGRDKDAGRPPPVHSLYA